MRQMIVFSRRVAVSCLVAFWSVSLVLVVWTFIASGGHTFALGFVDLYAPWLACRCTHAMSVSGGVALSLMTISSLAWEVRTSTAVVPVLDFEPIEPQAEIKLSIPLKCEDATAQLQWRLASNNVPHNQVG